MNKDAIKEKLNDDYRVRLVLLFVLGLLIGVITKTEAIDKISYGFDDYRAKAYEQGYDFDEIRDNLRAEMEAYNQAVQGEEE